MSDTTHAYLELARQHTAVFAAQPNVKAILLTGSVAQGRADENSDLDLIIYYESLPTEAEFEALHQAALDSGGGFYGGNAQEGFALYQYIDGIRQDFAHGPIEKTESLIDEFLTQPNLEEESQQIILSGIVDGLPLHGQPIIQMWQEKLAQYPPDLGQMLVEKHLHFRPRWVWQKMGADRNEIIFLQEEFLTAVKNIFGTFCGLNQLYHPGKIKGIDWTIRKMQITPPDLASRLQGVFQVTPNEAIVRLSQLIEETLSLVETHMPAVDTTRTREVWEMILRK